MDDIEQLLWDNRSIFDFSNQPRTSKLWSDVNAMKLGFWKGTYTFMIIMSRYKSAKESFSYIFSVEMGLPSFFPIKAICAPTSKVYSVLCDDDFEVSKNKGVRLREKFQRYKNVVLQPNTRYFAEYQQISRYNFELRTEQISKQSLSSFTDKFLLKGM